MERFMTIWRKSASSPSVVVCSLVAGVVAGLRAPEFSTKIGIFGDIYVDLLKMIVLPFMVSAVIFSLRQLMQEGGTPRMLQRVVVIFIAAMIVTALAGQLASLVMTPGADLSADTLSTLGRLVGEDLNRSGYVEMSLFGPLPPVVQPMGFGAMLLSTIPSNIFAALSQGDTLKALVFSMLFGLAIGKVAAKSSDSLTQSLETVYRACQKLTHWFNYMLPVVLFSMVASQVAKTGLEPMRAMLNFIVTLGIAAVVLVALSLWLLRRSSHKTWREVLRSQREPLTIAVATRSSTACMPSMIDSLVDGLHFPRSRIELLVPLGVSLLRLGPVLYYVVATFFIAQMYGRVLLPVEMGMIAIGAILAGFASAGMSGLITISLIGVVCSYIGLPFEAVLVLFATIDPVCDIFRTIVLVATNNAFAALACSSAEPS